MSGEQTHEKGREGARRAKEWLDATTRVNAQYVNPNPLAIKKLTFPWTEAKKKPFSYDLGGYLLGGDLAGQEFLAECKFYDSPHDQGTEYVKYLAKCYCAYLHRPERCDNFMWITWAPFLVNSWKDLMTADRVAAAVLKHCEHTLCETDEATAKPLLDHAACEAVADRLWIIVLSERQETLVISREHRAVLQHHDVHTGGDA